MDLGSTNLMNCSASAGNHERMIFHAAIEKKEKEERKVLVTALEINACGVYPLE